MHSHAAFPWQFRGRGTAAPHGETVKPKIGLSYRDLCIVRPAGVEPASRATVNGLGATPQLRHTDAPYIINSALIAALGRALSTSPRYYICVAERVSSFCSWGRSHPQHLHRLP